MRIGWHTYEPGLSSTKPNSAGGSAWTRHLWDWLQLKGHRLFWSGTYPISDIKKLNLDDIKKVDVIVFYWRWRLHPSYEQRNKAYQRQNRLIKLATEHKIPMVIHDGDHKMLASETTELMNNPLVTLTAPELKPRKGFRQLMYPNPHLIKNPLESRYYFMSQGQLIYIGNNYERWDQFLEFIAKPAALGMRTMVLGNWLEEHPAHSERQTKEEVLESAAYCKFLGRVGQHQVIESYLEADCTVHLAKPSYMKTGFITMRWAEAASAGTLAFIPVGFEGLPEEFKPVYVRNGEEVVSLYKAMTEDDWLKQVMAQQNWVRENMVVQGWEDLIKEAASR